MAYAAIGQTAATITKPAFQCATEAEKAQAARDCMVPQIKGLGMIYGSSHPKWPGKDACWVAQLPLCPKQTMLALLMPQPQAQRTAPAPAPTPLLLSRMPGTPAPAPVYAPVEAPRRNMAAVGLLALLVVGGGGYLVWRSARKKAA